MAEPLLIHLPDESVSQGFIEIIDAGSGNRVVSVIEVLSLANKTPGMGQDLYRQKQRELHEARVNLVEVDLLRAGRRLELDRPLPPAHYYAFVSPADRRPECVVYPWTARHPLPKLPVPLRSPDPDAHADLQAAFRLAYQRGRYGRLVDYVADPPPPAFEGEWGRWVVSVARGSTVPPSA